MPTPPKEKAGTEKIPAGLQVAKANSEAYRNAAASATDIAAAIVARRFRLPPVRARLVCHLAGIGGAS